jgi:hypothetical protein
MSEEFDRARWTLPPIVPVLIAFAIVLSVVGIYSYRARPGLISQGKIAAFKTFPIHTETARAIDRSGVVADPDKYDQMLVMAHINLKDLSKDKPLYIKSIDAKLTTADQTELTNTQAAHGDQDQFFAYYKQLADFKLDPLMAEQKLSPGQDVTGLAMFSFGVSPDAWKNRKDFAITISFYDQNPIVLHAPAGS